MTMQVKLHPDHERELVKIAKKNQRSVSGEVRVALDKHIAESKPKGKKP